jgi:hypothetical protein
VRLRSRKPVRCGVRFWITSTRSVGRRLQWALAVAVGECVSDQFSGWRVMGDGDVVVAGRTLETGADGRAAIALPGGMSLRVDRETDRLVDASRFLERGTLYLDSDPARSARRNAGRDADQVSSSWEASTTPAARRRRATARARGRVGSARPPASWARSDRRAAVIFGDRRIQRGRRRAPADLGLGRGRDSGDGPRRHARPLLRGPGAAGRCSELAPAISERNCIRDRA